MATADTPIAADELDGLFRPFAADADNPCVLAVSGGSDSTALMVLFADWLARSGRAAAAHAVVTVDHGLRAGSAEEARSVGIQAERL
jgi:tRNA(Ile)-lysidine synthase